MAKDPAFLFYPGDFTTGTQFFSDEQVGKYIRLLMAQHQLGHLKEEHMIKICKTYDNDIFSKFIKDSNGLYYNERLEDEIVKRKKYSESRSKNRSVKKNICKSYDEHMENKNKDINNNINNNIGLIEKWFLEFPNSSQLDLIGMNLNITKENLASRIPEFKKIAKVDYPNFNEFCNHFKNWVKKNPQTITLKTKELK
jgi:uncharacterized protein YdaU (DUF1376 family)